MEIYKKGQGNAARWITAGSLGALAAFGCYELSRRALEWKTPAEWAHMSQSAFATTLGIVIFVIAAGLIAWLVNLPKFVDYLILSEVELRKVSWPTKLELQRQTTVVIIALVAFSLVLLFVDQIFGWVSLKFLIKH